MRGGRSCLANPSIPSEAFWYECSFLYTCVMVLNLLDLSDEDISFVFLALGSATLRDCEPAIRRFDPEETSAIRSLASCCRRLDTIYRSTVRSLRLSNTYSELDCTRLLSRYPHIAALKVSLCCLPGYRRCDFPVQASRETRRDSLAPYPSMLIHNRIKSITLQCWSYESGVSVRELRAMLEKNSCLEELVLDRVTVYVDRRLSEYSDEDRTLCLERHAATLQKLVVTLCSIVFPSSSAADDDVNGLNMERANVDLRWFRLSSLTALCCLKLDAISPQQGSFIQYLAPLVNLEDLSLEDSEIGDEEMQLILSSLPLLCSVDVSNCRNLSYRVMAYLPSHLTFLDVSRTRILDSGGVFYSTQGRKEKKTVSTLRANYLHTDNANFGLFLKFYSGASISNFEMGYGSECCSEDLINFLFSTPNIRKLDLSYAFGQQSVDLNVFNSISKLTALRELTLSEFETLLEALPLIAYGPCRRSLRLINFRNYILHDCETIRQRVLELFDRCDVQWPDYH